MRRFDFAALAILSLVTAPILVAARAAQDRSKTTQCAENLETLWKIQTNYMIQYGGRNKLMPQITGDSFWLKLSDKNIDLIDSRMRAIYQCPVENVDDGEGTCDYRGPASDVNKYFDADPVGADVDGNHGRGKGGCVLRKSGDVLIVRADDEVWAAAEKKTTGGNYATPPQETDFTAKQLQAFVRLAHIYISIMLYHELEGKYPKRLRDLVEKPKDAKAWPDGGYFSGALPSDPWGFEFQYEQDDERPRLWTWGADGKKGGAGENKDLTLEDLASRPTPGRADRSVVGSLKTLATAQADFRSNDRDNNRITDFWTGDVAGLYCIDNSNVTSQPTMIKLIELSLALADASPDPGLEIMTPAGDNYSTKVESLGKRGPKDGYWFVAMKEDRSTIDDPTPYQQDTGNGPVKYNTSRFGFCAYPAEYGKTGTKTFIINEANTIFWMDTGGKPVDAWPSDEDLAKHWKKLD